VISEFDSIKNIKRNEKARAAVPISVLKIQFESIPDDFKLKVYPRLSWYMDWLNAYAVVQLVLAIVAALIEMILMMKTGSSV
jgi:hypothetical protein